MKRIQLGLQISEIADGSFADCKKIEEVVCYADRVPNLGYEAFEGSYIEYATLKVPNALLDDYKKNYPWRFFGTIVGIDGSDTSVMATKDLYNNPVHISINNGIITASGLCEGDKMEVYSSDGKVVNTVRAKGTTVSSITPPGTTFVKIRKQIFKVIVN